METKYWPCSHIEQKCDSHPTWTDNPDFLFGTLVSPKMIYCPYCNAQRPEPKKDELYDIIYTYAPINTKDTVQRVRNWIKEKLPEGYRLPVNLPFSNGYNQCLNDVKKTLGVE